MMSSSVTKANKINEELKNTIQCSSMDKFYQLLNYYKDKRYKIDTYISFFRQFALAICEIKKISENLFILYTKGDEIIFCFMKEPSFEEREERICVVLHKPTEHNNNISIGDVYNYYHADMGSIRGNLIVGINSNKTEYSEEGDFVIYGDCGCSINLITGKVEGPNLKLCDTLDKKYLEMFM